MELYVFARFHAHPGNEIALEQALAEMLGPTRDEPGCLSIHTFRSIHDPRLFYIHSRWVNEASYEIHATLRHTICFIERIQPVIDHPLDVTRSELFG